MSAACWTGARPHVIRWSQFLLMVATLSLWGGCGGPAGSSPDAMKVAGLVAGIGDLAGRPEQLAECFVEGAKPDNLKSYGDYGYDVVGPVKLDGDTATVDVRIFGGVLSPAAGDKSRKVTKSEESTKTWTLQLVGEDWKIKDAPLP